VLCYKLSFEFKHFGLLKDYIYESFQNKEVIPIETKELGMLIKRISGGETEALELLYREMKDCVFGLALVYTKSYADADDVVHDTFLAVWKNADTYTEVNPKSWIMTIARNFSLKCIKRKNEICEYDENILSDDFSDKLANVDMINKMLENLGEKEREIVMLYSHGFSHSEIAKITGSTYATVRWKYRNAIKKLTRLFGDESENE